MGDVILGTRTEFASQISGICPQNEAIKKAKGYALRLFKLRPRAVAELRQKMTDKGHASDVISAVIEDFLALGVLDDAAFAKAWMRSRLNKPMGFRRIARELADKGIAKGLVQVAWAEIREDYDEFQVARTLAVKRAEKYTNIDPLKRKKRVMDYLARRGFQMDIIMKVIRAL